ncbi:hypothetical protein MUK42_28043 [Musa troglodytarum]|uniref:Transcription elongation factor 1 homolog n=1 Tax=Musa troglodytarum TaxID=320322 RepID=A0A9E7F7W8_9LILI|nr:hypothetical protein MUK42_28043 [Musa troglodytarum]
MEQISRVVELLKTYLLTWQRHHQVVKVEITRTPALPTVPTLSASNPHLGVVSGLSILVDDMHNSWELKEKAQPTAGPPASSHGPPRDRPALYKPLGSRHHSLRILASVTLVGFREVGEFAVFFPFHRDMKNLIGEASCRICLESFSTTATALTEPIDIYSEWIDECERVNNLEDDGA